MRWQAFFSFCIFLFVLVACTGVECRDFSQCEVRQGFDVDCLKSKCVYTPTPGVCGNGLCDGNENKCTCSKDCGTCGGKIAGSIHLGQKCVSGECVDSLVTSQLPVYVSMDAVNAGDKFKIDIEHPSPFNLKADRVMLSIVLSDAENENIRIKKLEATALTKDKRTITIARAKIDKPLWKEGDLISQGVILDFPTAEIESDLKNIQYIITYDYVVKQGTQVIPKEGTLRVRQEDLLFVNPKSQPLCPSSCDDKNLATRDVCGSQTKFFCIHEPIPNMCGNFVCDGNENKCTCPKDCGPCLGSMGTFLELTCKSLECVPVLKKEITFLPNSIFDDRSLGPVQLNNNYKYPTPFNVNEDVFTIEFGVYRKDPTVSDITIETVRLLEGQQQLAEVRPNLVVGDKVLSVQVSMLPLAMPEESHMVNLGVWYRYNQSGQEKQGNFQKQLGKITFVNPK